MLTLKSHTMLGGIASNWETRTLAEMLSEHYPGDWGEERGPHMASVLRSTNLTSEGRLNVADVAVRALSPLKATMLAPKQGDILLERSGGGPGQPVGRVGFIEHDMPGYVFSNFLHLIRPDPDKVNSRFLGWVLYQINQTGRIVRLEQQTTQMRNLNLRDYLTMPLPYPPPKEQAVIALILDAVDTAVERTRETVQSLDVLQGVVLEDAFANLDAKHYRLGTFATEVRYGTSVASNDKAYGNPVLRIPNVVGDRLALNDLAFVELSEPNIDRLKLTDGDLLLVRTNGNPNYVGRSVVFRRPDDRTWVYASYLIRVRLKDKLLPDFVNTYLGLERGRRQLLQRVTTSAGNHNINANGIRLIRLPVPPPTEQERLAELATAFRSRYDALTTMLDALKDLKKSLMHDLLTGKIQVGDRKEVLTP